MSRCMHLISLCGYYTPYTLSFPSPFSICRSETIMLFIADDDGKAYLVDVAKSTVERQYAVGSVAPNGACFSPRQNCIIASDKRKCSFFLSAASQQPALRCFTTEVVTCCSLSSCGSLLLCGSDSGVLLLWSLVTGQLFRNFKGHLRKVNAVAFSGDDNRFATASDDSSCRIWETASVMEFSSQTLTAATTFTNHSLEVNCCQFHVSRGDLVATGSSDKSVRLFSALNGVELRCIVVGDVVTALRWSPLGDTLAAGTRTGFLYFWSFSRTLSGLPVMSSLLASGSATVARVETAAAEPVVVPASRDGHCSPILFLLFDSVLAGNVLTVSAHWKLLRYNCATGRVVDEVLEQHHRNTRITSCAWFPRRRPDVAHIDRGFSLSKNPLDNAFQNGVVRVPLMQAAYAPLPLLPPHALPSRKRQRDSDDLASHLTESGGVAAVAEASHSSGDPVAHLMTLYRHHQELSEIKEKLERRLQKIQRRAAAI